MDIVRTNQSPCSPNALCGFFDTSFGGTNDGDGAFSNAGGVTVYEFSHPLDSPDDANDFSLAIGDIVGFYVFIRLQSAGSWPDKSLPSPEWPITGLPEPGNNTP